MKPSILKKLNLIMEEANDLKDKNKFQKAIDKFEQALNFINIKVDEPSDKKIEIENIRNAINQTYSVEIDVVIQESLQLKTQKEYEKAEANYLKALKICEKIDDRDLKEAEIREINELMSEIEIEKLLIKGIKLREENKHDEAIKEFNKGINLAEKIQDSVGRGKILTKIQNEINQIYESQLNQVLENGRDLKQSGQFEEAIKIFEKAKVYIEKSFSPDSKQSQVVQIKNLSNEIYSNQIKQIVEKGRELLNQELFEKSIAEFKKALSIVDRMYESDLKKQEISLIADSLNFIYLNNIKSLLDGGKELAKKENFAESVSTVNETVDIYYKALDITKHMISSETKEITIKEISDLINQTCLPSINIIKDKSVQLIGQHRYDEAIDEVYVALSLAKRMTYPEEQNVELEELKNLVNKVYSVDIKKVLNKGNQLAEQKKYDEAIKSFNEALNMTNKMYLTEEMEKQVSIIKGSIYDAEVGLLVGKGKLTEEQQLKEKEIEKLRKRLEYAKSIDDDKRRVEEMNKIKKLIDDVHSEEIKLLIEQGDQLADKKAFKEAFNFYDRALKVNEMMEEPDIKNKDLIKDSYKRELINKARIEIENEQYDTAIEDGIKSTELDNRFLNGYYYIGLAYNYKKKFNAAIENFKKALTYDENHIDSLNLLGLVYESKKEYDIALEYLNKVIEIDPTFSQGWFNRGSVYSRKNNFEEAIESYTKAVESNSEFAKAWFFMGIAYFNKKDYNNTLQSLEKAIKLDPKLAEYVNPLIKEFKTIIEKLKETLNSAFINRE
ncbi:MAG: tetratricopeptide repeat protein [Promethearchaeota archaeon]|jgi:tetratricopeptide (TPR) repeat protein